MIAVHVQPDEIEGLNKVMSNQNLKDVDKVSQYLLLVAKLLSEYLSIKPIASRCESMRLNKQSEGASTTQIQLSINIAHLPHYDAVFDIYKSMNQTDKSSLRGVWYLYNCLIDDMDNHIAMTGR